MEYALEMRNITKKFGNFYANKNINLRVKKQEVHALLGENGAGKSTLMSILFGLYQADEGEIYLSGIRQEIKNPKVASDCKIGMVHQHFKLVPVFTVLENIVLGQEPQKGGFVDLTSAHQKVQKLMEEYGLQVDLQRPINKLSVGEAQRVEILKMLYRDCEILIFDEPTAVLTPQEIEALMVVIKGLVAKGKSVIFISHKLNEIKAIADRCTILQKGEVVDCVPVADYSVEALSTLMVGRPITKVANERAGVGERELLRVSNLSLNIDGRDYLRRINFQVKAGEIVAILGIDGNGQHQLAMSLAGLLKAQGSIQLGGQEINSFSIRQRNLQGLSYVPQDRHRHGLVLDYPVGFNTVLKTYFQSPFQKYGFLNRTKIDQYAETLMQKYDIRTNEGVQTIVRNLSGGNQQKIILAREISNQPQVLILEQPTRGLDVGAIEYLHQEILRQKEGGMGIILISLELEEVYALADRILVIYEGEIVGELTTDVSAMEIGLYMSGAKRDEVVPEN